MSAGGITLDGVSNSHGLLIEIQLAMIRAAQRGIFCFDSTNGRRSPPPLCGLERIHVIVTDADRPAELVSHLRQRGLEVVIAQAGRRVSRPGRSLFLPPGGEGQV